MPSTPRAIHRQLATHPALRLGWELKLICLVKSHLLQGCTFPGAWPPFDFPHRGCVCGSMSQRITFNSEVARSPDGARTLGTSGPMHGCQRNSPSDAQPAHPPRVASGPQSTCQRLKKRMPWEGRSKHKPCLWVQTTDDCPLPMSGHSCGCRVVATNRHDMGAIICAVPREHVSARQHTTCMFLWRVSDVLLVLDSLKP